MISGTPPRMKKFVVGDKSPVDGTKVPTTNYFQGRKK